MSQVVIHNEIADVFVNQIELQRIHLIEYHGSTYAVFQNHSMMNLVSDFVFVMSNVPARVACRLTKRQVHLSSA